MSVLSPLTFFLRVYGTLASGILRHSYSVSTSLVNRAQAIAALAPMTPEQNVGSEYGYSWKNCIFLKKPPIFRAGSARPPPASR